MEGAEFFGFPHALAIRADIQPLPVKIVPHPPGLAHFWSICALAPQLLGRTADHGIVILTGLRLGGRRQRQSNQNRRNDFFDHGTGLLCARTVMGDGLVIHLYIDSNTHAY
jgi:hypothetical protein